MDINYFQGARLEVRSYQLENKLFGGETAEIENTKYMASLQLDDEHICSAGLFKKGFLITLGQCGWFIENGVKTKNQKGTAVLGNENLEDGQKVNILKIAYHPRFRMYNSARLNNVYDFAVIMVGRFKSLGSMIKSSLNCPKAFLQPLKK